MTLEQFNKLYVGKAVHCKTEEHANEFLKLADSFGYKWFSGHKLTLFNEWDMNKDKTCYMIHLDEYIIYGNINEEKLPIIKFKGVEE